MIFAYMLIILSASTGTIERVVPGFQDATACQNAVAAMRKAGNWAFYDANKVYICIPTKGE